MCHSQAGLQNKARASALRPRTVECEHYAPVCVECAAPSRSPLSFIPQHVTQMATASNTPLVPTQENAALSTAPRGATGHKVHRRRSILEQY